MSGFPDRIGGYRVDREIGRGGMGVVFLGHDDRLDRPVAIKCLPDDLAHDPTRLRRLEQEARALASLDHPHIASIYGLEHQDGRTYLILEYLGGESLEAFARRRARAWRPCVEVAASIAEALAAAHARGVIHRDIKPDNVRFTRDGRAKLLDFGLAVAPRETFDPATVATTLGAGTLSGSLLGTPGYMAPEQVRGEPADARSDIFAFGCMLHELLTGRSPFARTTVVESLAATLNEEPGAPSRESPGIPIELDAIVARCLSKSAEDRFQSGCDLAFALRHLTPGGAPAARRRRTWAARRGRLAVGAIVATAMVAGALALRRQGSPINSLAVLPFVNESGDPDANFLCEGIAESIINRMNRTEQVKVSSRNASFRHAGREHELEEVAEDLGVRAILTGRIMRHGELVVIGVTLEDVQDGGQLWGERYERPLADILALEADIVDRVAIELSLRLSDPQRTRLATSPTPNADAYLSYLEGNFWQSRVEGAAYERAVESYSRAIALDGSFALAYAGRALLYCNRGLGLFAPAAELRPSAEADADRAVSLDPSLAQGRFVRGFIQFIWGWDFDEAERELREAIRLEPDLAWPYQMLAHVVSARGRFEEALELSREATRLEPRSLLMNSCQGHFHAWKGDPAAALAKLHEVVATDPRFGHAHVYLGRQLVATGRPEEGIAEFRLLRDSGLRVGDAAGDLGWALGEAGRREEALAELAVLAERAKTEFVPNIAFARVHAGLLDAEQTMLWLERAVEAREAPLPLIRNEPHFRRLHGDPRFVRILERIGIAD